MYVIVVIYKATGRARVYGPYDCWSNVSAHETRISQEFHDFGVECTVSIVPLHDGAAKLPSV